MSTQKQPLEQFINGYIGLKDKKEEIERRHKEELAPINDHMAKLRGLIMDKLDEQGGSSFTCPKGTATIGSVGGVSVEDMEAFRQFLIKDTSQLGLLNLKPRVPETKQYIAEHNGELPPGVKLTQTKTLKITKGKG
jgi:hypothetical protein